MQLYSELRQEVAGEIIPYVEIGVGEVGKHIRTRTDMSGIMAIGIKDDILNLSRLGFGASNDLEATFDAEISALATVLRRDAEGGSLRRAAIPLAWEDNGLIVTLSEGKWRARRGSNSQPSVSKTDTLSS